MSLLKRIGEGVKRFRGSCNPKEFIETGILSFDITYKGLPRKYIKEKYDDEASIGKTTIALQCCKQATNSGLVVLYFSIEHELSKKVWTAHGVDLSCMALCTLGSTTDIINTTSSISPDLLVIDSLASVVPPDESFDSQYRYTQLREFLRELTEVTEKTNSAVLITNQRRSGIYNKTVVGGVSVDHWAYQRLSLRSLEILYRNYIAIGRKIEVSVALRDQPFVKQGIILDILFNTGVDTEADILELGLAKEIVTRKGSLYQLDDTSLGRGKENVSSYLKINGQVLQQLKERILSHESNYS